MRIVFLCIILCLGALTSCSKYSRSDLIGHWTAVSVLQDKQPLKVNPSEITLAFTKDGTYYFTSTLDYQEAGVFDLKGEQLWTTDTIQQPPKSKTVLIEKLSSDSLHIKMRNQEDWMFLTMVKK